MVFYGPLIQSCPAHYFGGLVLEVGLRDALVEAIHAQATVPGEPESRGAGRNLAVWA